MVLVADVQAQSQSTSGAQSAASEQAQESLVDSDAIFSYQCVKRLNPSTQVGSLCLLSLCCFMLWLHVAAFVISIVVHIFQPTHTHACIHTYTHACINTHTYFTFLLSPRYTTVSIRVYRLLLRWFITATSVTWTRTTLLLFPKKVVSKSLFTL